MIKRRCKKAQFYIIAAVIIVLAVISMSSVVTYSIVKSEPKSIIELSQTLETESPNVVKYGLYNNKNITELMENFTEEDFAAYFGLSSDYATTNITFVYGNRTLLVVVKYIKVDTGGISVVGTQLSTRSFTVEKTPITPSSDKEITVVIYGIPYTFELEEGQIFYFVLTNEKNGEIYVETNSPPPDYEPGKGKNKDKNKKPNKPNEAGGVEQPIEDEE